MNIDIQFVAGEPGDIQLTGVTTILGQAAWLYDREAEVEASRELGLQLRQLGAELPKHAITCKVERTESERLIPKRIGFQIAILIARAQGFTVGFLEERIKAIDGEAPSRYLIGEVRRGSNRYEVFVVPSGRRWEAFEAEIDGPASSHSGLALGHGKRLPDACRIASDHIVAHGARKRRRIVPRNSLDRRAASHV